MNPLISVIIPVYNSEELLEKCLQSVALQTFSNIEIIVVNDCSSGKDLQGRNAKKIAKSFKARYFEHSTNKGILEARRTGVENSHGEYCLFLDSDDTLPSNSILTLYQKAVETGADIVHGTGQILTTENTANIDPSFLETREKKLKLIHDGFLKASEITQSFLCKNEHAFYLWGKLYKSELLATVYSQMPSTYCVMAEDLLLYFFITQNANLYCGIKDCVYNYNIDSGITSRKKITALSNWEKVCSASSVFTILYSYLEENKDNVNESFFMEQTKAVQRLCCTYVMNNVKQLHACVDDSIYKEAFEMLCDYWGKSFVEKAEAAYNNKNIN